LSHRDINEAFAAYSTLALNSNASGAGQPRELLFSSVVELMLLVTPGLRPSLHAAARKMAEQLPVSLAALHAKVQRTEPAVLRALVQGSAERPVPLVGCLPERQSLPGWQLGVFDGNHLPASEKRLAPLRGFRGAALPGHTLAVYDPDSALVCDIVACEDAHLQTQAKVRSGQRLCRCQPRSLSCHASTARVLAQAARKRP
jgi:IS4 transposase